MKKEKFTISLPKNPLIKIKVVTGHFATANTHVNQYIDMSELKSNTLLARDAAKELAMPYLTNELVDTIVCMDGTEVIAAYVAEELFQDGMSVMNSDRIINILTPLRSINRKLIFQSNVLEMIQNKNIILLVDSASSGRTIGEAIECIDYYGGEIAGVSALFNAMQENLAYEIHALFSNDDIPGYQYFHSGDCALCRDGHKLDAIINSGGYTNIN